MQRMETMVRGGVLFFPPPACSCVQCDERNSGKEAIAPVAVKYKVI